MAKLKFRRFKETDWHAFAGAEEVPGGPLIAESTMKGRDVSIIVDKNGVGIYDDEEAGTIGYTLDIPFPAGKIIAFHLSSPIEPKQLTDFGFKKF